MSINNMDQKNCEQKLCDPEIDVCGAPVIFSTGHKRPYNPLRRPEIHYKKMVMAVIGFAVIIAIGFLAGTSIDIQYVSEGTMKVICCLTGEIIYLLIIGKKAIIWLVHLYQNKASDATRLKCVFEPSCSEYMIMAVEKYGLVRGVIKGIGRLSRCHAPHGGKDYP